MLFLPVKMMKETKGRLVAGACLPLNRAHVLHRAADAAAAAGRAVTVLTYLHGVKEAQSALAEIQAPAHYNSL